MSLDALATTIAWAYIDAALFAIACVAISILLVLESRTVYSNFYGEKVVARLKSSHSDHSDHQNNAQRVHNGSDVESNASNSKSPVPDIMDKTETPAATPDWRLQLLPLLMYLSYIASALTSILFKLGIGAFVDCAPCGVQGTFFMFAKTILYCIFIYRLHAVYSESIFRYNTKCLVAMAVTCVVFPSGLSTANFATATSVWVEIGGHKYCACVGVPALGVLIILFDTIISVICCCMFIKPMKAIRALDKESRDSEMYAIVLKYVTLTCVVIISTMLFVGAAAWLKLNALMGFDGVINSICVFSFNKKHDSWFKRLCCEGKCVSKAVDCCCSDK